MRAGVNAAAGTAAPSTAGDQLSRRHIPDLQGPLPGMPSARWAGIREERARSHYLRRGDEGNEVRSDGNTEGSGLKQSPVAAGLARQPRAPDASRLEAVVDLRPGRNQALDLGRRQEQLSTNRSVLIAACRLRPRAARTREFIIHRIIKTAMMASISAAITVRCKGLLIMCRSMPKRVPSGSRSMPHFGHLPAFG